MTFAMISYILMYFGTIENSFHSRVLQFHGTRTKTGENPTSKFDLSCVQFLDDRVSDVHNRCNISMWVCEQTLFLTPILSTPSIIHHPHPPHQNPHQHPPHRTHNHHNLTTPTSPHQPHHTNLTTPTPTTPTPT